MIGVAVKFQSFLVRIVDNRPTEKVEYSLGCPPHANIELVELQLIKSNRFNEFKGNGCIAFWRWALSMTKPIPARWCCGSKSYKSIQPKGFFLHYLKQNAVVWPYKYLDLNGRYSLLTYKPKRELRYWKQSTSAIVFKRIEKIEIAGL